MPVTALHDHRIERFHALYRDEFAFVWAAARRLGVPPAALDDAVQDIFVTAYRRLEQLHYEVSPRAWLYGVTRRIASRYRRGAYRRTRRVAALAAAVDAPAEPPQERTALAHQLDALLHELGDGTRAVWEMTELLGMTGPEIASELGLPLNTIYSRLRLARGQLQRRLAELELAVADRRADDRPPERAAQRAWIALLPGLRSTGTGLAMLVSARAAVAGTLLLAGAAVVLTTTASPPDPTHTLPDRPPALAQPLHAPAPAPARDRFAEEVALLDRAHARLGVGDVTGALAAIAEHTRDFSDGALIDVREAARVQAHCLAGEHAQARERAARLLAEHPGSAVAQRHEDFECSADEPPRPEAADLARD